MIYLLQFIFDHWYLWVGGLLILAVFEHVRRKKKADERRAKRAETIAAGGVDPLPSNAEVKKLILYMFLGVLPIFLLVVLANA